MKHRKPTVHEVLDAVTRNVVNPFHLKPNERQIGHGPSETEQAYIDKGPILDRILKHKGVA